MDCNSIVKITDLIFQELSTIITKTQLVTDYIPEFDSFTLVCKGQDLTSVLNELLNFEINGFRTEISDIVFSSFDSFSKDYVYVTIDIDGCIYLADDITYSHNSQKTKLYIPNCYANIKNWVMSASAVDNVVKVLNS